MKTVFIDTSYILALINPNDQYHDWAVQVTSAISKIKKVTTEAVIVEIGNAMSKRKLRALGATIIQQLKADAQIEIVPVRSSLLNQAIEFYASRSDKDWGLTDCISFVVMEQRQIQQVVTADEHFMQAGFSRV